MKVSEILEKHGDVNIPERTLIMLGIEEEDRMIAIVKEKYGLK